MSDILKIAVVSGKGGVGKTMLAVAVANELAKARPTLIIDLDFFNRGLTGLMATLQTGAAGKAIAKPSFLAADSNDAAADAIADGEWTVHKVAKNLHYVSYPDLTESEIRKSEVHDVAELASSLSDFIREAAAAAKCDSVVLDCHGGPDNSSFAACLVADHSLLVSEPDRITLFGTLNFLRQFWGAAGNRDANIHLVFNKVVPAFSATFLMRFYDRQLREEFNGRPLLAIYPMEVHLTKEFEKTPFLTNVYPTSMLARKTRILLHDLLALSAPDRLVPSVRNMTRLYRFYYRASLGHPFFLFDLNFVMPAIVAGVMIVAALYYADSSIVETHAKEARIDLLRLVLAIGQETNALDESEIANVESAIEQGNSDYYVANLSRKLLPEQQGDLGAYDLSDILRVGELLAAKYPAYASHQLFNTENYLLDWIGDCSKVIDDYSLGLAFFALFWFATSMLLSWHRRIDIRYTYHLRRRNKVLACAVWMAWIAMWWWPAMIQGYILYELAAVQDFSASSNDELWLWPAAAVGTAVIAYIAAASFWRGIRDLWYDARFLEASLRLVLACYLIGTVTVGYR